VSVVALYLQQVFKNLLVMLPFGRSAMLVKAARLRNKARNAELAEINRQFKEDITRSVNAEKQKKVRSNVENRDPDWTPSMEQSKKIQNTGSFTTITTDIACSSTSTSSSQTNIMSLESDNVETEDIMVEETDANIENVVAETLDLVETEDIMVEETDANIENVVAETLDLVETSTVSSEGLSSSLTKEGNIRKRAAKRSKTQLEEDMSNKKRKKIEEHPVRESCQCKNNCRAIISDSCRKCINRKFWNSDVEARKQFVSQSVQVTNIRRRRQHSEAAASDGQHKKMTSRKYNLKSDTGEHVNVCKTMFLTTLGFKANNDTILKTAGITDQFRDNDLIPATQKQKKTRLEPYNKINKNIIKLHIGSFNPEISHYRRVHAPLRRYLPSDITLKDMHSDYTEKYPDTPCSYQYYCNVVKEENISFANLGNEECESCAAFKLHNPLHNKDNLSDDCQDCLKWKVHLEKYEGARTQYKAMKDLSEHENNNDRGFYSADLQKVIMLPRMDHYKKVIFTRRIVAFNESFVPLGQSKNNVVPFAAIWHEGIAGRKAENIISAFHAFFVTHRHLKKLTIFLDNCAPQNKNWMFLSYLVFLVNSDLICAVEIVIIYFEPGHSFMSADSFHHQVEDQLKKSKNVYDFGCFSSCVQNAKMNKMSPIVKELSCQDFYKFKDFTSQQKLKRMEPRVYLKNIVSIKAERGIMNLLFKSQYEGEWSELNFIQYNILKNGFPKLSTHNENRGVETSRKNGIIKDLLNLMPEPYRHFWVNLPDTPQHSPMDDEIDMDDDDC
jgi:hypothetical protein